MGVFLSAFGRFDRSSLRSQRLGHGLRASAKCGTGSLENPDLMRPGL